MEDLIIALKSEVLGEAFFHLENLIKHFSDGKVIYRKTTHSIDLTKWLIENKPEQLQDIADLLKDVLMQTKCD